LLKKIDENNMLISVEVRKMGELTLCIIYIGIIHLLIHHEGGGIFIEKLMGKHVRLQQSRI